MQWRLQFMRHIGGEFPAYLLSLFLFRYSKEEQRGAPDGISGENGAGVYLISFVADTDHLFSGPAIQGL